MERRVTFVVGHANFGKSETIRALRDKYGSHGRCVVVKATEFLTRNMSNDDRPESYIDFLSSTRRTNIIAALCPKFEALKNGRPSVDRVLSSLRRRGYALSFWVISHQWSRAGDGVISSAEIKAMESYGLVGLLDVRDVEATERAKLLHDFILSTFP